MAQHNDFGKLGEERAQMHLIKNGYTIRHTNWKYDRGELDIVAEKDDQLVVVEVKSRSTEFFEHPKDAITDKKIRKIVNTTQAYIEIFDIRKETRFDVISVLPDGQNFKIEHIEDAFLAPIN
ncbi:YraN family protein [Bacteroidales bacterium OttesenSCG-928-I21]|nr:YraN family protein [Bacteroidales bacterium OttesenSCG-928-I21]